MRDILQTVSAGFQAELCGRASGDSPKVCDRPAEWGTVCNSEKENPVQVFSCEYCKIIKSTYFEERLQTAASD